MNAARKMSFDYSDKGTKSLYPARPGGTGRAQLRRGKKKPQPNGHISKKRLIRPSRYIEYIYFNTGSYRIPFRVIFTILLIFAGGVGTAFTSAYLQDMRRQINSTRAAIFEQRSENTAINAVISPNLSIQEIEYIAINRLNMGPAEASQIIRINVPRQSYVIQSEASPRIEPQNMWQSAWWHIRAWLSL